VTVVDETRGVLPGATVTLAGVEASNKAAVIEPASTSTQGLVKFENLAPGRYAIKAEFSGFQTRTLPDVRIRSGENRQVVVLPIDRVMSSVTVERDRQTAASDRDVTFGTVLTREQIDALSDDPDELRRQLMDIAGPDAKLLIDSFEGRDLPPKALIKSIRITRDGFAPECAAGRAPDRDPDAAGHRAHPGQPAFRLCDSAMDGETRSSIRQADAELAVRHRPQAGRSSGELLFSINFNGRTATRRPCSQRRRRRSPATHSVKSLADKLLLQRRRRLR
jgi:hypothetical protein